MSFGFRAHQRNTNTHLIMCTTTKCFITNACLYSEVDDEGEASKGLGYHIVNCNVCTKWKSTSEDDKGGYLVTTPTHPFFVSQSLLHAIISCSRFC